jgi:hypothetical protein
MRAPIFQCTGPAEGVSEQHDRLLADHGVQGTPIELPGAARDLPVMLNARLQLCSTDLVQCIKR